MTRDKFELSLLADASPDVIAWLVPGNRLFNWLCRSILVPAGWAVLGWRNGQDPRYAKAGDRFDDEETQDLLFIRSGAFVCSADATDLRSSDGFLCGGALEVSVRVIEEPTELAAFRRTLMGSTEVVRRADLQRQLEWEMRRVLAEMAESHTAEELLARVDRDEVRRRVDERLGPVCFAGGMSLEGPVVATFHSPAYREHCRQQAAIESRNRHVSARTKIQQALAEAQKERLGHLTGILGQLSQAAEAREDLSIADLLRTFSESERAEMYAALWSMLAPTRKTREVAIVSGQELLLFQPADFETPVRRLTLPDTLGPLRSVSVDVHSLEADLAMVGARLGVYLVDLHTGDVVDSLSAGEIELTAEIKGGVNAAAMSDDHVWATHSELGVLAWPRRMFNPPVERLFPEITAGADTVRSARFAEGYLWFAVDEEIWAWPQGAESGAKPTHYPGSGARISALEVAGGMVYAGNLHGQIIAWQIGDPESARVLRGTTGSPVESIELLDGGAIDHLVVADRGNALQAIVVDDSYIRRYESGSTPVRRAAVADDLFVAMNDNRDRLLAWDPRKPAEPSAMLIVPHLTGSTIQDLCIIPQA